MEKDAIFAEVKDALLNESEATGGFIEDSDVTLDADLCVDLGLDSLDRVGLATELERKFNITLDSDEYGKWDKVEDIVEFLSSKI